MCRIFITIRGMKRESVLTDELVARCAIRTEPITGRGDYNHLSVRAAAAILLDRLLGTR